jgi:predicted RNA-binding protein YlqC (UPF0109 family)
MGCFLENVVDEPFFSFFKEKAIKSVLHIKHNCQGKVIGKNGSLSTFLVLNI